MMSFADPIWLFALPFIAGGLIALYCICSRHRRRDLAEFASARVLDRILISYSPLRRRIKETMLVIAIIALIGALARPQLGYEWRETRSRGIDILFALDVSRSMLAEDVSPNRLARAKLAIEDFVSRLEGDRIGLIAFAGDAFLQCPLTLDYNAFFQSLESMSTDTISRGGSDIAAAIDVADAAFGKGDNFKNLILVSDGEDLGAEGIIRARQAAGDGVRIFTVGIGTAEGSPIPIRNSRGQVEYVRDEMGKIVESALDEATLQTIAEVTGGFYVPLGRGGYGLDEIYEQGLSDIPREELSSQLQKIDLERFQWPLAIAILLLAIEPLLGTRRLIRRTGNTSIAAVLLVLLVFLPQHVPAADAQTAWQLLRDRRYAEAEAQYRTLLEQSPNDPTLLYNQAIATLHNGNTETAVGLLERALPKASTNLQASIHYNIGVIELGKARGAIEQQQIEQAIAGLTRAESEFLSCHDITPDNKKALTNAQAARAILDQLEKQQQEQQEQQQNQSNQSDQADPSVQQQQQDQSDQSQQQQSDSSDKSDQSNQSQQSDRSDQSDKSGQDGQSDQSNGSDQGNESVSSDSETGKDQSEQREQSGQQGESDRSDRSDTSDQPGGRAESSAPEPKDGSDQSAEGARQNGQESPGENEKETGSPESVLPEKAIGEEDASQEMPQATRALSLEEALRILDSYSESERYLPFSGRRGSRDSNDRRNW